MLREKQLELICRLEFLRRMRHHGVKLSRLDELRDDVYASHELAAEEDLREGGPVRVELEPLSDALVFENVEVAEAIAEGSEELQQPPRELALRSLGRALDEDEEARRRSYHVLNLPIGLRSLLLEPLSVELLLLVHRLSELFWGWVFEEVRRDFVRVKDSHSRHLVDIKLLHKLCCFIRVALYNDHYQCPCSTI